MKTLKTQKRPTAILFVLLLSFLIPFANSCSTEDTVLNEQDTEMLDDIETVSEEETWPEESSEESSSCTNPIDFVFTEKDGLVSVEFEKAKFSENWAMKSDGNSYSGEGYMVWEGTQHLSDPGNGRATFKIKISNIGTYKFVWKSAVKIGNNGTDHNDTWLRFGDANNFYAKKDASVVYPNGSGKTPNPEGASKEGWFKIYRSGNNLDFKWQSSTFDNNGHEVFVVFDSPGTYLMEVSARSSGHAIDKFVLFKDTLTQEEAVTSTELSTTSCN